MENRKTNIPPECLNCRWLTYGYWCVIHGMAMNMLDNRTPLLRDVRGDELEYKRAIFLVKKQQTVLLKALDCAVYDPDKTRPVTNKDYIIALYSRTHLEEAERYKRLSDDEMLAGMKDYCRHPSRMAVNGEASFYGILLWNIWVDYPTRRFIYEDSERAFDVVLPWLRQTKVFRKTYQRRDYGKDS